MNEENKIKYCQPTVTAIIQLRMTHVVCLSNQINSVNEEDYGPF